MIAAPTDSLDRVRVLEAQLAEAHRHARALRAELDTIASHLPETLTDAARWRFVRDFMLREPVIAGPPIWGYGMLWRARVPLDAELLERGVDQMRRTDDGTTNEFEAAVRRTVAILRPGSTEAHDG
jgi:hypothetical protein